VQEEFLDRPLNNGIHKKRGRGFALDGEHEPMDFFKAVFHRLIKVLLILQALLRIELEKCNEKEEAETGDCNRTS
jgi:hypothetical protein